MHIECNSYTSMTILLILNCITTSQISIVLLFVYSNTTNCMHFEFTSNSYEHTFYYTVSNEIIVNV